MSQPYDSVPDTSVKPVAARSRPLCSKCGLEDGACICAHIPVPDTRPVRPAACEHDWKIWPETNGQSQRCMKCGAYRDTPDTSQHQNTQGQ